MRQCVAGSLLSSIHHLLVADVVCKNAEVARVVLDLVIWRPIGDPVVPIFLIRRKQRRVISRETGQNNGGENAENLDCTPTLEKIQPDRQRDRKPSEGSSAQVRC